MATDRFALVGFTEPTPASRSFEAWPQHFTVLPWMVGDVQQSCDRIARAVSRFDVIDVTVGSMALFDDGDVSVVRLQPFDEFKRLHRAARTILHGAARVEDPRFLIRHGYNPRVTLKEGQPTLEPGDEFQAKELCVVQATDVTEKHIVEVFTLGEGHEAATRR